MTKVGFTGTSKGMTRQQLAFLIMELQRLSPSRGRHGDCVGADAQFDALCEKLGVPVIIHPPEDDKARAFCKGVQMEPKPYLKRNRDIVDASNFIIAASGTDHEVLRSGTWYTVRYARRLGRDHVIVYPDGRCERSPHDNAA